jgi:predicted nucleotidyltransferase component of viral defense system
VLPTRLERSRYVLKGGANLRYFFASRRYSEDIDIDLIEPVPWSFETQVDKVMRSPALRDLLAVGGLALAEHAGQKQTDTTHRWRVAIDVPGAASPIRSKVEFSNRGAGEDFELAFLPDEIVTPYALRPPSVQHYGIVEATEQKVSALAGRSQTEVRDVFDLELLLRRQPLAPGSIEPDLLDTAIDRIFEQDYDAFRDKVLAYLEPGAAELISTPAAWEEIQTFVASRLEAAR